jgi:hypothetical protein
MIPVSSARIFGMISSYRDADAARHHPAPCSDHSFRAMIRFRFLRIQALLGALAILLGTAPMAFAQLQVTLELNRKSYVAFEPIHATITIANRAGKDIVLGDPSGRSWLSFNVDRIGGDSVLPYQGSPRLRPHVLGRGESIRETISLGRYYPLGGLGNYSVRANVYYSEFGQHITSNTRAFAVTDGSTLWKDQIGINKPGQPTSYREMSLLSFQEDDRMTLYVRIRDERSGRVLATYAIGRLVLQQEPQATLDDSSNLHAFFLTGPKMYRHIVIDPDGKMLSEEIYEAKAASTPELKIAQSGAVRVAGGQLFDPNRPDKPKEVIRRLSDRPLDVPNETVPDQ